MEKTIYRGALCSVLLITYQSDGQIKKREMDGAWGTGEVHTECWWGNLRERDHLENLRVDWGIILKLIFKKWDGGTD
jgi:hypothetical protein